MTGAPRISVAMTTCNGEAFVAEQLQSVLDQSRPADEIVIFDDASDDATIEVLRATAATAPGPVTISRNPARLGVVSNFEVAVKGCSGDIIVLADQDDRWHGDKLEVIGRVLSEPGPDAAFSDARIV